MMFCDRDDKLCAGPSKKAGPLIGVKLFGRKLGDKVFVASLALGAVGLQVMLKLW